jgi:hypothetical protein
VNLLPRVIAALATLLWTSGVEGVGLRWAVGYVCIILAMAVSATVIAAVWAIALHLHDADRRMLIRAVGDLTTPRSPRATRPLRLAR